MRILVNLVGLSHHTINGNHSYEKCHENLFNNLINPLKEQGHKVDFFLKTYHTDKETEIERIYNPIYSEYSELKEPKSAAFDTYISSIEKLKDFDYDFYIVTRFDLWIGEKFDLHFNKFNFLFKESDWWDNYKCTTDTFYGFPKFMLNGFVNACIDCRNKNGQPGYIGLFHALHLDLQNYISQSKFHFIEEEKQTIQTSQKYKLSRYL